MKSLIWLALAALMLGIAACTEELNPVSADKGSVDTSDEAVLSKRGKQTLYAITHLASLGGTDNQGNGINNQRWVVGASNLPGNGSAHATLWKKGTLVDLGTLGGPGSNSNVAWPGVNSRGMIVGISETGEPGGENWSCRFFFPSTTGERCVGFLWQDGVMSELPTWPGGINGFATGINNRGQIVGWAENGVEDPTCNPPVVRQFRGFLLDARTGKMRELAPLPGDSTSTGNAINERGQVVGISGECANAVGGFSARHAVLWEPDGTAIDIGNLGGEAWHTPMDINERSEVVGFGNPDTVPGDDFGIQAFYWSRHSGIVPIGVLEGQVRSQALGINNRGQVVGQSSGSPAGRRAFLWKDGILTDLNDLVEPSYEGILLSAGSINDAGVITGAALDPETGATVTFIATPNRGHR